MAFASRVMIAAMASASAIVAAPAVAAPVDYVAMMSGKCTRLILGGQDGSEGCIPKVVNDVHKDGRVGFTFGVGDVAVVTFSGMGQQQVKDSAEVVSQPLDVVIFTLVGMGTAPNKVRAAGVCTYGNPYAGPAAVNCSAHTSKGTFEARFVSDGREPLTKHF